MNPIDPKRSALLVMDMQVDIVAMLGDKAAGAVERTAGLIAAARAARLPVIYIVVAFRPGYPELSPRSPAYERIAQSGRLLSGTRGAEVVAALRPQEHEPVVVKHRVSAFAGTGLEPILRAQGIDTLVLLGLATSGVVLSTVRQASDADYQLVVVEDCCADADDEVHRVLTGKVLARQAAVVAASEVAAALGRAG